MSASKKTSDTTMCSCPDESIDINFEEPLRDVVKGVNFTFYDMSRIIRPTLLIQFMIMMMTVQVVNVIVAEDLHSVSCSASVSWNLENGVTV